MLDLGPLGQLPSVGCYIVLTLGFSIRNEDVQAVTSVLEKAANEIIQSYPWLAGQVVHIKSGGEAEPNTGTYKVVEYPPHLQASRFVTVKDCRNVCSSYSDIIEAHAPLSMLDGNFVSPAFGFSYAYPDDVAQPVVLMQANLVKGGMLLTSCGHHKTMDANGHEQFLRQFATLCRGEKLLDEHIRLGNTDQSTIFPPLRAGEKPLALEMLRSPSTLDIKPGPWPPTDSGESWKCFRFKAAKLASLKAEALKDIPSDSDVTFVSSDDALTAFIFARLSAVRSKNLPQDSQVMLLRCVNGRKRLSIPIGEGYMGHSIFCTYTPLQLSNVLEGSLSSTAIEFRRSLLEVDDRHLSSFFHLLKSEKDRTTINYGAKFNPATDLFVTSFVAQKLYSTAFGEFLGLPDFIKRPRLPAGKGLCYSMPKSRDGDIDLIFGLEEEEYEGLKADARWREFANVIE